MSLRLRSGMTAFELIVAILIVGAATAVAAMQYIRRSDADVSISTPELAMRAARIAAMRSGRSVSGAMWDRGTWLEYTALPAGALLIDSVHAVRSTLQTGIAR